MVSVRCRMARGENHGATMRRRRVWSGGSIDRNESSIGTMSRRPSSSWTVVSMGLCLATANEPNRLLSERIADAIA
jgi:hypothetical protein